MAGATDRATKRSQIGNRVQRGIWKSAHAWKHPWYPALCARVAKINSGGLSGGRQEARLDKQAQSKIWTEQKQRQREAVSCLV
jgi:hypothetical protein